MKKYFEVTVAVVVATQKNGKDKVNKEVYLVDSMTVTEAEAKVVSHFEGVNLDYKVVSAKESRVHEVLG
jgi:hypothetical protein